MRSTEMTTLAGGTTNSPGCGPIENAYDAWKKADAAARTIEREVSESWRRYERGIGAAPSSSLLREAASLRHAARETLGEVMGLLHDAVAVLGAPRPALH